jgi:hypothetical protein
MEQLAGSGTPEFLSTHPSHETRIANMEKWMPEALKVYEASPTKRPARKLPGIGGPKSHRVHAAAPRGRAGAYQRGTTNDGCQAIQFSFQFPEDVWLEKINVDVPGIGTVPIEANISVKRNLEKYFYIQRTDRNSDPLPPGQYRARFVGTRSGRPFQTDLSYSVRD